MLGTLKPQSKQSSDVQSLYQQVHCSTCKAVQELSWVAPLTLSREASFLGLLATLLSKTEFATQRSTCTAFPLFKKPTLVLPTRVKEIISSFSIIASAAKLEDHRKDHEHFVLRTLLKPTVQPHLQQALNILYLDQAVFDQVSDPVPAQPEEMESESDESFKIQRAQKQLKNYLKAHHSSVALVWQHAITQLIKETRPHVDEDHLVRSLSYALSDLMIIKDAIDDLEQDLTSGQPNPLIGWNKTQQQQALNSVQQRVLANIKCFYDSSPKLTQHQFAYQALSSCISTASQAMTNTQLLQYPSATLNLSN